MELGKINSDEYTYSLKPIDSSSMPLKNYGADAFRQYVRGSLSQLGIRLLKDSLWSVGREIISYNILTDKEMDDNQKEEIISMLLKRGHGRLRIEDYGEECNRLLERAVENINL